MPVSNRAENSIIEAMRQGKKGFSFLNAYWSFANRNDRQWMSDVLVVSLKQHNAGMYCGIYDRATIVNYQSQLAA